ncbi:GGDEF domain-containing protein [Butyrivibrio sp. XPD2006]|uniref:GGDEF domain-containing protein n=1 Tax=Butyrivibrio sp. XPD2006 TaxID=1280668 RepID=UPI0003B644E8|nr:GGDEF domain-containing protein [Butyrivibrio sp. XPD2006]
MISLLWNYIKINNAELREIKEYFDKCSDEIDKSNLFMLRRVCMYTSLVFLGMMALSYIIVPGFRITPGHIVIIPVLGIYLVINSYTRRKSNITGIKAKVICLVYYTLMCAAFIIMDLAYSERPVLWVPLALMVFPVLYIDRLILYGVEETIAVCVYGFISYQEKGYVYFIWDMYMVIAAYVISMIIGRIILGVRSKEGLALEEVRRFSQVDKLTNVLNKGALIAEIESYLKRRSDDSYCAMCIFDVDDFKQVNDGIGHTGGDALLEHIGELLLKNFRPTDIIGRFGGDEFVVFMPNMKELSLVEFRCRSLQMMLESYRIEDNGPFTLSIGAIVDKGDHCWEDMLRMADDALYKSKMSGKNRCSAWVVRKDIKLTKPGLVFLTTLDEENAQVLLAEESDRFDILACNDNDEAIGYVSQYHNEIKMVVIELNNESLMGSLAIRYIKEREIFSSIPVLAVVDTDEAIPLAEELGADRVLKTETPNELFAITIKELSGV